MYPGYHNPCGLHGWLYIGTIGYAALSTNGVCGYLWRSVDGGRDLCWVGFPNVVSCGVVVGVVREADYVIISGGQQALVRRTITRLHLDSMYAFKGILQGSATSYLGGQLLQVGDLVLRGSPAQIVNMFGYWRYGQLQAIALHHGIEFRTRVTNEDLIACITRHLCGDTCPSVAYGFRCLSNPRRNVSTGSPTVVGGIDVAGTRPHPDGRDSVIRGTVDGDDAVAEDCYLEVASEELKSTIIREWEQVMSTQALREHVCASCGRRMPSDAMLFVRPGKVDFSLLRNDSLPEEVLPVSYNRHAYDGAILHPKGLTLLEHRSDIKLCLDCHRSVRKGRMPKYALANWLYYGHDRLPEDVKQAFKDATQVERVLVSRA